VVVSARVKGVREDQQISALLLVPLFVAALGEASGSMFFDPPPITALTLLLVAFDIIMASVKARKGPYPRMPLLGLPINPRFELALS
jgi:hypothetical protein